MKIGKNSWRFMIMINILDTSGVRSEPAGRLRRQRLSTNSRVRLAAGCGKANQDRRQQLSELSPELMPASDVTSDRQVLHADQTQGFAVGAVDFLIKQLWQGLACLRTLQPDYGRMAARHLPDLLQLRQSRGVP